MPENGAAPRSTPWLPPEQRPALASLDVPVVDQDGEAYPLARLADRPLALAFFYVRCDNPNRCALTVNAMVRLQRAVERDGLGDRVRLLLATYEPQADTPAILKRFGADRGFRFGSGARMLRPDPARAAELFDELAAPVNFSAGWVNVHGLVLYLIDGRGRYVRTYHTLLWDSDEVLRDLQALAAEPR
jgi:protein SCO1/2